MTNKLYRIIYMLPANTEEKALDEFVQKFTDEVTKLEGKVINTKKKKNYLVKTSQNKGARGVFTITSYVETEPSTVAKIERFLKLAQGIVINYMALSAENEKAQVQLAEVPAA